MVDFKGGRTYVYRGVPPEKWVELTATSIGTYLHKEIIGKYDCKKVEEAKVLGVKREKPGG